MPRKLFEFVGIKRTPKRAISTDEDTDVESANKKRRGASSWTNANELRASWTAGSSYTDVNSSMQLTESSRPVSPTASEPDPAWYDDPPDLVDEREAWFALEHADDMTIDAFVHDDNNIPVRILNNFTILCRHRMVNICELHVGPRELLSSHFNAIGDVRTHSDMDDGFSEPFRPCEEVSQPLRLSHIREFSHCSFNSKNFKFDHKIYLRTKFAWYILENPSQTYAPLFSDFFVRHTIMSKLLSATLLPEDMDRVKLLKVLRKDRLPRQKIGRSIESSDLECDDLVVYLSAYLVPAMNNAWVEGIEINPHVSVIKDLLGDSYDGYLKDFNADIPEIVESEDEDDTFTADLNSDISDTESSIGTQSSHTYPSSNSPPRASTPQRPVTTTIHSEREVVITKIISVIAEKVYRHIPVVVKARRAEGVISDELDEVAPIRHDHDPETLTWGPQRDTEDPTDRGRVFYNSITMDDVLYEIGQYIMVNPGIDESDSERAARAAKAIDEGKEPLPYANTWFASISQLFEENGEMMAHVEWFVHGNTTLMQEIAHPNSLFRTYECDDIRVESILSKCRIDMLDEEDTHQEREDPNSTKFHCGLVWDPKNFRYTDLLGQAAVISHIAHQGQLACVSCALNEREKNARHLEASVACNDIFTLFGETYHPGDCIYTTPNPGSGQFRLFLVVKIRKGKNYILGRELKRWKKTDACPPSHMRRVVAVPELAKVNLTDIHGRAYLRYLKIDQANIKRWMIYDDHYFLAGSYKESGIHKSELVQCEECLDVRWRYLIKLKESVIDKPLKGLELFAGAGGLSTGMDLSGYIGTKWAVELDPKAATTLQNNHPETTVYCQDVGALLKHSLQADKEPLPHLEGYALHKFCAPMPKPGEVDIVFGGPPCQAFSRANHMPKADDIRATLPATMLAYVEFYRPKFFLLENVRGMLSARLMGMQETQHKVSGGIEMGVVKFVVRGLIALGYQVEFRVLQAAQYGTPQSRNRVIILAAQRGLKLPDFPVPTHVSMEGDYHFKLPGFSESSTLPPVARSPWCTHEEAVADHRWAPNALITVNDAISDLPGFEYYDPNNPALKSQHPLFHAAKQGTNGSGVEPGFLAGVAYRSPPLNLFQDWVRKGAGQELYDHRTFHFKQEVVERIIALPFKSTTADPKIFHKDLPEMLRTMKTLQNTKNRFYGRLDPNGLFRTTTTNPHPTCKGTFAIHPSQRRMLSFAEFRRGQGFPDSYDFGPNGRAMLKQLGNAVPVPLALALGKCIGEAWLESQLSTTHPEDTEDTGRSAASASIFEDE